MTQQIASVDTVLADFERLRHRVIAILERGRALGKQLGPEAEQAEPYFREARAA